MAFKQLYECEFCGKTKYFFPEQAIGAKCECETSIDLNNTWCEANKENEKYLYENVSKNTHNLNKEKYFIIERVHNKLDVRTINYVPNDNYKKIHLVNGKFEFVESKPKNNFKDYGFKADFEGEILKEVKELKGIEYLGYFVGGNKTYYPCIWTKSGRIWKTSVSEKDRELYNLKQIKKEWYENPDITGKILKAENKETGLDELCILKFKGDNSITVIGLDGKEFIGFFNHFRPATKEEVLSLLVK